MESVTLFLFILFLFQLKHFITDFPLQSYYEILGRINNNQSWFLPLVVHGALHGLFTVAILLIVGVILTGEILIIPAIALGIFDAVFHIFVDSGVLFVGRFTDYTLKNNAFVQLFGLDQLVHQLTYLVIIWLFFYYTGIFPVA